MPECHTCEWNGRATRHCISCKGPSETNHHGQTFVSLDALNGQEDGILDVQRSAENILMARHVSLMRAWLSLDRRTCRLVAARLTDQHIPLRVIAKRLRISTQAAHARLKKAREKWPALEEAIPMKLLVDGKRKPGKNHHA